MVRMRFVPKNVIYLNDIIAFYVTTNIDKYCTKQTTTSRIFVNLNAENS